MYKTNKTTKLQSFKRQAYESVSDTCMVICSHHFGLGGGVDAGLDGVCHVAPDLDGVVNGALRGVDPVPP